MKETGRELQCPSSIGKDLERTEAGRGMRRRRAWNSTLAWVKIIATSSSEENEASSSWWMASPPALSLYETLWRAGEGEGGGEKSGEQGDDLDRESKRDYRKQGGNNGLDRQEGQGPGRRIRTLVGK